MSESASSGLRDSDVDRQFVVAEQGNRPVKRARDRLGVAKHLALGPQLLVLAGQQARGVDLRGLELQQIDPFLAKLVVQGKPLEPVRRLAPGAVGLAA